MFIDDGILTEMRETRVSAILQEGQPMPIAPSKVDMINCYAYAIGLTYTGDERSRGVAYNPGFTFNRAHTWRECFEENVCKDLDNLQIPYKKLTLDAKIEIPEKFYLIKAFNRYSSNPDFHFCRYVPSANVWLHKNGWRCQPEVIRMPETPWEHIFIKGIMGQDKEYVPVGLWLVSEP